MRYLGNKSSLLPSLTPIINDLITLNSVEIFVDVFGGTGSVGEFFKNIVPVCSCELLYSSYLICRARIQLTEIPHYTKWNNVENMIQLIQASPEREGYVFNEFSEGGSGNRLYFSNNNGKKIDGIIHKLYELKEVMSEAEFIYIYYIFLESVHTISNTTGVYGAFLKKLQSNAKKPLTLSILPILPTTFEHTVLHGESYTTLLPYISNKTLLYLDPPYNARQYSSNYHVLETIASNTTPPIKIIKNKISISGLNNTLPMSLWCSKHKVKNQLLQFLRTPAQLIVMSYNSESLLSKEEIVSIMQNYGSVLVHEFNYKRYKSNTTDDKCVIEYLFVCSKQNHIPYEPILPVVQWVGGKRRILEEIKKHIPLLQLQTHTYYEPFLGGGSILLNIQPNRSICIERNKSLCNVYVQVRNNATLLMNQLNIFHNEYFAHTVIKGDISRQSYYNDKRTEFNMLKNKETNVEESIIEASLFIFLNHTGFNGMYRENKKGMLTIPFGTGKECSFYSRLNIERISAYLQTVRIINGDYKECELTVQAGDVVYLDPPYHNTFNSYDKSGWTEQQSIDVIELFIRLTLKKVHVLLSNSNTDEYKQLFLNRVEIHTYTLYELSIARTLNSNSTKRKPTTCELLIVNIL